MKIRFSKYQGAGNDFIIVDNRNVHFDLLNYKLIRNLCDRRMGIGADGLMLLNSSDDYAFEMIYFNADGKLGSMCGNGARCIVAFAKQLEIFENDCTFLACDGPHYAEWTEEYVRLKMNDVTGVESINESYFIDTGSPHYVSFVDNLEALDVMKEGQSIRYNERFKQEGTNVNFVQLTEANISIRTYERGVESETLACGTGAVASAIATFEKGYTQNKSLEVKVLGGWLKVDFQKNEHYSEVFLTGPYKEVFKGELEC
ncbi:MAG: diaminopimelate epimerase [Flavobacteriales bacterium]|nr:diaminopimelate epimerase [Flavobacteriales bacterium]MBL6873073.1 diaminopimelate epimerase [Flavobacteriales bacterium]